VFGEVDDIKVLTFRNHVNAIRNVLIVKWCM